MWGQVYLSGDSRQTIAFRRRVCARPWVYLSGDSRQTIASPQSRSPESRVYLSGDSRQTIAMRSMRSWAAGVYLSGDSRQTIAQLVKWYSYQAQYKDNLRRTKLSNPPRPSVALA